ncbi:CDP-glycerol--glycerophosphate glycerophosphotransferase [Rhodohalobacter sp. SW132]|uniref:CDP-glycerol glycerophosphotransferase family protein n=1 Tax=Rhodohalobacter sp. SW132 TaxID=2293433 RepID=UPI000E253720|nr:CDP-glycerol glycerophosphotransferase family protein [Rhodohalobacter sp. SW132]REL38637.1 CDP-glycerol--glycerophosphate glycerophosphotransferase [Rhodohalobacter sp. SW132]
MTQQAMVAAKAKSIFDEPVEERMKVYRKRYCKVLDRLKNKSVITVGFQVIHRAVWKYNRLYQLMEQDPFFEPVVFVCPYLREGSEYMLEEMNVTFEEIQSKGYKAIKTYDEENDRWIDIKSSLNPDIVFYSVPFDYTRDEYRLHHYTESLSCYVPYFFTTNGKEEKNYDGPFHNLVWRNFYETEVHKQYAQMYARNGGDNVVVSGYPPLDDFLYPSDNDDSDPWPLKDHKRIIWAPHHTIEGQGQDLDYSTFKQYYEVFQDIALEYSDRIQIAFKPHPMLKEKLYKDEEWGKERTNAYYDFWKKLENGLLEQSGYTRLFLTSDALIHDCSSFMVEYLSTSKPPLYLLRDENVSGRLHEFGKKAFEQHYHAHRSSEIIQFIDDQILNKQDVMQAQRHQFVAEYLKDNDGFTASENIIKYIKSAIRAGGK